MKQTHRKHFAARIALLLIPALLIPTWFSLAETGENSGTVIFSNTVSVQEIATLAPEEETEGDPEEMPEETPEEAGEQDTHVSVTWLPDDTGAPDRLTVILVGGSTPQMAVLERSLGWQTSLRLEESTVPTVYTLVGYDQFTVTEDGNSITFVITLPEAELAEPVEGEEGAEGAPEADANRSVTLVASIGPGENAAYGDILTLTGVLTGYEGVAYTLQWQRDAGDGWADLDGATGLSYSFALNEENVNWGYRLVVTETPAEPPASPETPMPPETPEETPGVPQDGEAGQ